MRFTPSRTPAALKVLLGFILLSSVFSFAMSSWFALSLAGIRHFYLWQFATYLFIHPFPSSLLRLLFNLYFLWIFGVSLCERLSLKLFFFLFFGSGILGGAVAYCVMLGFHLSSPLIGSSSALYGLFVAWILLNPEAQLLLFFALSLKARHLLFGLIGLDILSDLSRSDWVSPFSYCGSMAFAYFFILILCRVRSPFPFLFRFENMIFRFLEQLTHLKKKAVTHAKIYDIKSGDPILNDEQFMDAMLTRVSLYGEDSLTPEEKNRMHRISGKKYSKEKL